LHDDKWNLCMRFLLHGWTKEFYLIEEEKGGRTSLVLGLEEFLGSKDLTLA
jgi:hypothetical protein